MKKTLYRFFTMAMLAVFATACSLDQDPESSAEPAAVFSTYGLAEKAVMAIHQSFAETNSYRGRYIPFYGINSDVEWINNMDPTKVADDGKYELCTYATRASNTQMNTDNNAWAKFYEGIERANNCIVGLRTYGNIATNTEMAYLLGEALTLRAVIYLDLLKGWGDVPARFEPISTETLYIPRTDRDTIYKHLLADLKEAENYVAWPNKSTQTATTERVSKAFVKGLRARIALYAGGYSQRSDGIRLSNDPELSQEKMYTIAKDECLDVVNQGANTLGTFKENFTRLCQDVVAAGGESLWEIPFSSGRGRVVYTLGVKHNAKDQYTQQAQGGVNGPLPHLFYDYDVEDIRRDITCVPYEWSAESLSKQQLRSLKSWCFGKYRYEWMSRIVTSTNDDGVNWQYMRLADVYLMAAEAINYLNGPSAAAPYLKAILDRALPAAKVTAYMATATSGKDPFFDAIVEQRGLEFAGESLRKADLIRWNLLKTKLDEAKNKMLQLSKREGSYADLPENLYYKTASDGETLVIYGLNHGETDAVGQTLTSNGEYQSVAWIGTTKLTEALINALYQKNPNENQFWPIWQTFVDKSNGTLTNP